MRALLTTLLLLCAVGCVRNEKKIVGVVPKGANHIFWQTVHAGAISAGQEYGFEIEWNAPTLEIDSSRQIEIVESMVNRKVAGIVLAPVDKSALVGVVERAPGPRFAREAAPHERHLGGADAFGSELRCPLVGGGDGS